MAGAEPRDISEEITEKTARPPADATAEQEVLDFLNEFAAALAAGDTAALAGLWEAPGLVVSADDVHALNDGDDVEDLFGDIGAVYAKHGITALRADVVDLQWIGERIAHVVVRCPWIDADGDEMGEEVSTVTLRRDDDGRLRLRAVLMHGAFGGEAQ